MDYIQAALRGDIREVAALSFDCIQCGLCSMRCPADIKHYHMAQMARRIYAHYLSPPPEHLGQRIDEIQQGVFEQDLIELMEMELKKLKEAYAARELE
jgi:Na+-translocating ferredoxin:NAD+ oxidoreductase RnfC subunit